MTMRTKIAEIALIILLLTPMRLVNDFYPVRMTVTAYIDEDGQPPWGVTASGAATGHGIVAADKAVPFGTKVYVSGYGWVTVEDRGGAIQGRSLDLWHSSVEEALQFGRQEMTVWVPVEVGWPE